MADTDLVFLPAHELAARIKARTLSPVELVEAHLRRIEALNPKVNAFITITRERALDEARQSERDIAAGHYRGPLHGLPYAPKDIYATKGILTTNGSKATAHWVPDYESTVTERMNRAGAILVGKLNLLEFAMGGGVLSGFGPARNPWDLAYSPSGSSSGSGVALAAGMVSLSVGTDTGGSIRGPANNCGIVGLKPTYGRVSRFGVTTLSWTLDHAGPMTRTVEDCAMLLQVIAGPDPQDDTAAHEPMPDYRAALTGNVKGLRIGVPTNFFFEDLKPEAIAAVRAAIDQLKSMGATLVDVEVEHAELAPAAYNFVSHPEGATFHEQRLKDPAQAALLDPVVRDKMESAKFHMATDYIKALRIRTILMQSMARVFEQCDLIAVPAGDPAGKLQTPEEARRELDAPVSEPSRPFHGGNTNIGDMTGIPAIVVPCGFTAGPPALPMGIMFYGKPFDEATLLRVAHAYEQATQWHTRHPALEA
jgi:aspartyl-tRNA(Asn)/glutamyl-tRNA(Gln) amidotransferase subunit A